MHNILIIGFGSSSTRHIKNLSLINKDYYFYILSRKKEIKVNFLSKKKYCHITKISELNLDQIKNAFICTGSNEHLKYIKTLSKRKIDIFVEKPLMNSTKKMKDFKKIYKKTKNKLYIGYNLLFSNSLNYLKKKEIYKENINKINIKAAYYLPFWRKNTDYRASVSSNKKKGGGVLLELSHELHYLLWLYGKPIWASAIVQKISDLKIDVEDNAFITLGFKKFVCTVELDFISKKYERYCKIDTDKNSYLWDFKKNSVEKFYKNNKSKILYKKKLDINKIYINQLKYFLNSNYKQTNEYIDHAINTLKVIESIRVSSSKNGAIEKIDYRD